MASTLARDDLFMAVNKSSQLGSLPNGSGKKGPLFVFAESLIKTSAQILYKARASNIDVFPDPFAPCIKLFNSEKSRFKLSKQRKFEIAIFFIDTFKLKAALLHILSLDRQRG